jgi:PD-(D/E)XK nuclease superfamily
MARAELVARALVAPGVREAEAWLFSELARHAQEVRSDLGLLARPVRVLVPGGPLRELTLDRMLRALGGAVVGIRVQTLWSLALEVLEALGVAPHDGALVFELAARRAAACEAALRADLEGLEDGAGLAAGALSDLLSARLESADAGGVERALKGLRGAERDRTAALVRAARAAGAALRSARVSRFADVYEDAARALAMHGPRALAARAIYVHGFSGATGQAAELLRALMQRDDARLLVVDPAGAGPPEASGSLAVRFARRLAGADPVLVLTQGHATPRMEAFCARGEGDELREVARLIRERIEHGARPESIGVVARALEPRALALRRAFEEHGVPFSGGTEPSGLRPEQRRLAAALSVLRLRGGAPADRWLDALAGPLSERREELRAALRASGVARLAQVADLLDAEWLRNARSIALPHRGAVPDGERAEKRPQRRFLQSRHVLTAADAARRALEIVERWPDGEPIEAQMRALWHLSEALGVAPSADQSTAPAWTGSWGLEPETLAQLSGLTPGLQREELARAIELAQTQRARELGGAGSGVRVLGAQEARGATFEHLFLIGLERGEFPRAPRPDSLLTDRAREALAAALVDLELKERQHEEERWLFAALASSAQEVVLSWRNADEDGREVAPSPFVVDALARAGVAAREVPYRRDAADRPPRSARELAVSAALTSPRKELALALELALEEGIERFGAGGLPPGVEVAELAAARLEVLAEIEPDRRSRDGRARLATPGPWLGAVGRGACTSGGPVYVTQLEALARCPWQGFLVRALGVEPGPDPLLDLPDLDGLLIGNAAHGALQLLLAPDSEGRVQLAAVLERGPREVSAPTPSAVERCLREASRRALEAKGLRLHGLALALATRARPLVERALALLEGELRVLGAEVEGRAAGAVPLDFRADLVLGERGGPLLIDFKTGKPISKGKTDKTRAKDLLADTSSGRRLQAMAYALATPGARGVYLFLDPEIEDDCARVEVLASAGEVKQAFDSALQRLHGAWLDGVVPPRTDDIKGKPNSACVGCEVRMACLRDDSGNRRRLREMVESTRGEGAAGLVAARAAELLGPVEVGQEAQA